MNLLDQLGQLLMTICSIRSWQIDVGRNQMGVRNNTMILSGLIPFSNMLHIYLHHARIASGHGTLKLPLRIYCFQCGVFKTVTMSNYNYIA